MVTWPDGCCCWCLWNSLKSVFRLSPRGLVCEEKFMSCVWSVFVSIPVWTLNLHQKQEWRQITEQCPVHLSLFSFPDFLPAPTLAFGSEVNQSAIKLYSSVPIVCTIPDNAKKPAEVHLSKANATSDSSPLLSYTLQRQSLVTFTLIARPDHESAFVCWYTNTRSNTQSQFSKPISIVICE